MSITATRREMLIGMTASLVIATTIPMKSMAEESSGNSSLPHQPNAFVRISPDNTITVISKHIEFGQGPMTGMATLVAEEMDADWSQIRGELAPANAALYGNAVLGGIQGTGGSSAIANAYYQMRKVGATARAMLVGAAAREWGVPVSEISVSKGVLTHEGSGKSGTFGDFAEAAKDIEPPAEPKLKSASEFVLIGTDLPKLDTEAKTTGKAIYALDMKRPDMVYSAVKYAPAFGGKPKGIDAAEALSYPDVLKIEPVSNGIAVIAKSRFAALKALDKVKVDWDFSNAETRSSSQLFADFTARLSEPGVEVEKRGKGRDGFAEAETIIEAEYRFPYLAHAPMAPPDAVIEKTADGYEIWMGTQIQTLDHGAFSKVLGLPQDKIKLNTTFAGGSFGRLATATAEFATEAAMIAKAWPDVPLQHARSREADIQSGYYRPMSVHKMRGGLDADGNITAWDHVFAIQSFVQGTPFAGMIQGGVDSSAVEGARHLPYDIPHLRVGQTLMDVKIPTLWWRSVGHTQHGYATETFVDELLEKGGKDPVEGRLNLYKTDDPRFANVLKAVADMADWNGTDAGNGRKRGVAMHKSFGSYVAQIAEVSKGKDGLPVVHKVWCAIDCGIAVNPNIIRAQMEGGIGFALGAALFDEITLGEGGIVEQTNFDSYRMLRLSEMPEIDVSIIKSDADPTGVGEPGVPPLAPALANAWRALTDKPVRELPFSRSLSA